jgi:thiamine biosynthesis protein ThiI
VGNHPFSSRDLAVDLGDLVRSRYPDLQVDLDSPEKEIWIEVRGEQCYLFDTVNNGPGGIPLGVEGTLVALISGGIDSPVSAWMMMKRGCRVVPIYVDMPPFLGESSLERVEKVITALRDYQPHLQVRVVQDAFVARAREVLRQLGEERYVCILCKRRMYRIAEKIAREIGAKGIVTGESMGQVASQTLDNLYAFNSATTLPLYRPLIGLDKSEIITIARRIGTYESSIMPVSSCCCAVPDKPVTSADPGKTLELERQVFGSIED